MVNDFVSDEEFDRLLHAWFGNIGRVLEPGRAAYGAQAISDRMGNAGRGIVLDIADEGSVQAAVKDVAGQEGSPTILVNNAGITRDNLLMRMKS